MAKHKFTRRNSDSLPDCEICSTFLYLTMESTGKVSVHVITKVSDKYS